MTVKRRKAQERDEAIAREQADSRREHLLAELRSHQAPAEAPAEVEPAPSAGPPAAAEPTAEPGAEAEPAAPNPESRSQ